MPIKALFFVVVLMLVCNLAISSEHNRILVSSAALADYHRFVADRDPLRITEFSGSRRDVVEMVLLQQALALSGVHLAIQFEVENDPGQILLHLRQGSALAAGSTFWLDHLTPYHDDLRISTALVSRGEFEVGFYVHPDAVARENTDLRSLRSISTAQWKADWDTLQSIGFDALLHWDTWPAQVDAVMAGEVSFLLAPFASNEEMTLHLNDHTLVPIPGIKLGLIGSRHMAVSRAHPESALFNSALQLGLLRLKREGVVRQAYEESGFLHPAVGDWVLINAPGSSAAWRRD